MILREVPNISIEDLEVMISKVERIYNDLNIDFANSILSLDVEKTLNCANKMRQLLDLDKELEAVRDVMLGNAFFA